MKKIILLKNLLLFLIFFFLFLHINFAQAETYWEKILGNGIGHQIIEASDGGLVITGEIYSEEAEGICLIKIDPNGEEMWRQIYEFETEGNVKGYSVDETLDGGFVITGIVNCNYYKTSTGDLVIIKTDAEGNEQWVKIFGDEDFEEGKAVKATSDGGYIIGGYIGYQASDLSDGWIIKLNSDGSEEWNLIWDEDDNDYLREIIQTEDDCYVFLMDSNRNSFLIKIDPEGNMIWEQKYYDFRDYYNLIQTNDGGFFLTGSCNDPYGLPYTTELLKTDSFGYIEWIRMYIGYPGGNTAQTTDYGYILAGCEDYDNYKLTLSKTNLYGFYEWYYYYGGWRNGCPASVVQTSNNGYAITGSTITYNNNEDFQIWLIYFDPYDDNNQPPNQPNLLFPENGSFLDPGLVNFSWKNNRDPDNDEVLSWLRILWWNEYKWVEEFTIDTKEKENQLGFLLSSGTHKWTSCTYDPAYNSYPHYSCAEFNEITTNRSGEFFWDRRFDDIGGEAECVKKTSDGGFIITGGTSSFYQENSDIFLLKTSPDGTQEWLKFFGFQGYNIAYAVDETSDSGYILTGESQSYENTTRDLCLIKTNSLGELQWNKFFRDYGLGYECGYYVEETSDLGFIITGYKGPHLWLIKADSSGNKIWEQEYYYDYTDGLGMQTHETSDGCYIVVGSKEGEYDKFNLWLLKFDINGNIIWERKYGTIAYHEIGCSVAETNDNGFIITGYVSKYSSYEGGDIWLVKTDNWGNLLWDKTFGGPEGDFGYEVIQTKDNGYVIIGVKNQDSYYFEDADIWLIKTNQFGEKMWDMAFGGLKYDVGNSVVETEDGGYLLGGTTHSFAKEVSCPWLIYFNPEQIENKPPFQPTLLSPENNSILEPGLIAFSWINNGDLEDDAVGSWLYLIGPENQIISYEMGENGFKIGEEISFPLILLGAGEWFWTVYIYDPNQKSYPYYSYQDPFWNFTIE